MNKEEKKEKIDKALAFVQSSMLTKYKIAQDTGISQMSIGNYKNGKKKPSFANAEMLIRYFEGIVPNEIAVKAGKSEDNAAIQQSALDIIMAQTKSLAKKDEHIDKLIDMLDNRLSALEKSNDSAVSSVLIGNSVTAGENEK